MKVLLIAIVTAVASFGGFGASGITGSSTTAYGQKLDKETAAKMREYNKRKLIWRYDPFRDETRISTIPAQVYSPGLGARILADRSGDPGPTILMRAAIRYAGKAPAQPLAHAILIFDMSAQTWQQLKSDREVRVMFDGKEIVKLGEAAYDAEISQSDGFTTAELLAVAVSVSQLERMASAKEIGVQIGRFSFQINDKRLKTLEPLVVEVKAMSLRK